ncbi:MAG: nucleoside-diphosphate kinase [Parcubacteria group bacterium Gr01-1014_48]|nr:MAG: nucleoside-diphosphate kinase [Parcubacteria group bacterium Greene0416_14]TSC71483.1 MAG: nucleoside-diphosphate kinase [Parcubacteria group bacterium Gr01-1014_48]TSD00569.1 MAG: nucleoside-diphosphate kinase [Parcubacteria group bacterium Greene1014_15]TSD08262.1 MAG: nucleoside-diphosphate kinase [Parcubacteria group bacterium Greene0714_4]
MEKEKKHHKEERTLAIIKPDGVQRSLIGEIILRYERVGLKLVAIKMIVPSLSHAEAHYMLDAGWLEAVGKKTIEGYRSKNLTPPSEDPLKLGETILAGLKKYMSSGPAVCMVWQGAHAVKIVRKITGGTEPLTSDVGTIRGDYVLDSYQMADSDGRSVRNLVHASGSVQEAEREIAHWFKKEQLVDYRLVQESILYDVNLDKILE